MMPLIGESLDFGFYFSKQQFKAQGSKLKKMSGRKFATSYENLVATLKMLVAKLVEAM